MPNLGIKNVTELVVKYVNDEFKKIGSKNKCECVLTHGGEPWIVSDTKKIQRLVIRADSDRRTPM